MCVSSQVLSFNGVAALETSNNFNLSLEFFFDQLIFGWLADQSYATKVEWENVQIIVEHYCDFKTECVQYGMFEHYNDQAIPTFYCLGDKPKWIEAVQDFYEEIVCEKNYHSHHLMSRAWQNFVVEWQDVHTVLGIHLRFQVFPL